MDVQHWTTAHDPTLPFLKVGANRPDEQRREQAIRESQGAVRGIKAELVGLRRMLDDIISRVDDDDVAPDEDAKDRGIRAD